MTPASSSYTAKTVKTVLSKDLNVLVIAQYYPPDIGGASTRVSNVVKGLLSKGCNITVVAAFPHYPQGNVPSSLRRKALTRERVGGINVIRVWIPALPHNTIVNRVLLHLCFIASSLFALPFVGKVDAIWAANPNLFCFYSALAFGFARRKPIIRNVDDLWPEVFYEMGIVRSKLVRLLLDFLAKVSYVVPAAVTPVSEGYKRRIIEKYNLNQEKVHVIEVGIDSVEPLVMNIEEKNSFVVMYSGALSLGYDFEVVLGAASILKENEDIVFVVRGVGELASRLKRQINKLNLGNLVLSSNFLSTYDLSVLLSSADAFMLPMASITFVDEGLPAKVFEYQAYGKPIVCVSDGEPARYVKVTESGLVAEPKDACGLAQAIIKLHSDREFAFKLGLNGWRYVSENMTAERIGERVYCVLEAIRTNS